jgi:hypothetical protein
MKNTSCFILTACLILLSVTACGTSNPPASQPGADIIQQYNFHVEGEPTIESITLPQQFNGLSDGPFWAPIEHYCGVAGFDLTPYAGATVTSIEYHITETLFGSPVNLWVIAKDQTSICGFISMRPASDIPTGGGPAVAAVNDPNIVHPSN